MSGWQNFPLDTSIEPFVGGRALFLNCSLQGPYSLAPIEILLKLYDQWVNDL